MWSGIPFDMSPAEIASLVGGSAGALAFVAGTMSAYWRVKSDVDRALKNAEEARLKAEAVDATTRASLDIIKDNLTSIRESIGKLEGRLLGD